jgi:dTDP-4-dehydrorhamnose reductase
VSGTVVIGATGTLGRSTVAEAARRGHSVVGMARSGADLAVDVADADALIAALDTAEPDLVVNCAAIVDLAGCERDPGHAYVVNARAPGVLAEWSRAHDAALVQISTDHFFTGDGRAPHAEDAPVRLLNEYARTKYAGEVLAVTAPRALVVRTNLTGLRGVEGRPTFIEWVIGALQAGEHVKLFDDYFTSTLDADAVAVAVLDLVAGGATGLLNVASSQAASKEEFVLAVAARLGLPVPDYEVASVRALPTPRAESAALDVSRAEALLGRRLPDLTETVDSLVSAYAASPWRDTTPA